MERILENKFHQQKDSWFHSHFEYVVEQISKFISDSDFKNKRILDVGCGDGITDLSLVLRKEVKELVAFDCRSVDKQKLLKQAKENGVSLETLPPQLIFITADARGLPFKSNSFDLIISWSAFEHIPKYFEALKEARRILKPTGSFFIQIYPLYFSKTGSHLDSWLEEGFDHLIYLPQKLKEMMLSIRKDIDFGSTIYEGWSQERFRDFIFEEFLKLNRITLGEFQKRVLKAKFFIKKIDLNCQLVEIPIALQSIPIYDLAISGFQMLLVPNMKTSWIRMVSNKIRKNS